MFAGLFSRRVLGQCRRGTPEAWSDLVRQAAAACYLAAGGGATMAPVADPTLGQGPNLLKRSFTNFQGKGLTAAGLPEKADPSQEAKKPKELQYEDLVVQRTDKPKPKSALSELLFGKVYTDHMLQVSWKAGAGWGTPAVGPLAPLQLHPCAQVLHYGMECFEGMKAYMGQDKRIRLFRPDMNMARLNRSAARFNLPAFSQGAFLECLKELLRVDEGWLPDKEGYSMYIRPTMIATTPFLGVGPATEALLYVVLSPVGPYFPTGLKPIRLFVDTRNARAWPGGVGDCKAGGNYAPTILPQVQAAKRGCQQVLYCLETVSKGDALVGESGAMNVFFFWKKRDGSRQLVTPPLDGLILPGVTRDTVLSLCRSWGEFQVTEREVLLSEVVEASDEGRLLEMFGTGTAVIIQPISGLLQSDGHEASAPYDGEAAESWLKRPPGTTHGKKGLGTTTSLVGRLTREIMDIQYGYTDSKWSIPV